ncbi:hypothetical protein Patl1_25290 [Pistacia atlantica]|uniref:Uncharacterized protein n=1 Tax=Pistacia atlantica TaxID=434234 RepID=A0ACC1B2F2_9ROSI|nr:hypothetical protein Patl1_25290 [Pistacia atlantica]
MEEKPQIHIPRVKLGSQGLEWKKNGKNKQPNFFLYLPQTQLVMITLLNICYIEGLKLLDKETNGYLMKVVKRVSLLRLNFHFEELCKIEDHHSMVSRLGFGCGGLSGIYNAPLTHEAGCSVIKEAFSKGITLFDTADIYGVYHDNEIMVGKALKQLPRDKIQLATKFGCFKTQVGLGVKGTPEYVRQCCEASLKRLDVDHIDLYYQHRVDTSVPIEDTVGVTMLLAFPFY